MGSCASVQPVLSMEEKLEVLIQRDDYMGVVSLLDAHIDIDVCTSHSIEGSDVYEGHLVVKALLKRSGIFQPMFAHCKEHNKQKFKSVFTKDFRTPDTNRTWLQMAWCDKDARMLLDVHIPVTREDIIRSLYDEDSNPMYTHAEYLYKNCQLPKLEVRPHVITFFSTHTSKSKWGGTRPKWVYKLDLEQVNYDLLVYLHLHNTVDLSHNRFYEALSSPCCE